MSSLIPLFMKFRLVYIPFIFIYQMSLSHKSSLRGTQRLFSVQYLLKKANIA